MRSFRNGGWEFRKEAVRFIVLNIRIPFSHPDESPHTIYIQNYSSAASSCILLRKWCFNIEKEISICAQDQVFKQLCFYQAVNDVNNGIINVKERLYQLKALQTEDRCDQVRSPLNGHSQITFVKNWVF